MHKTIWFLIILFSYNNLNGQSITGVLNICQGSNTTLAVIGATGNPTFQWQLSTDNGVTWNNVPTGGTNSSIVVSIAASYQVIVTTAGVPSTLTPVIVTVNPKPIPNFTFTPNNSCSNTPVSFLDGSTGSSLSYLWSFGDPNSAVNNTSSIQNPQHQFIGTTGNNNQSFSVKLKVTNGFGCSDSITTSVTTKQLPSTQLNGTGKTTYNNKPYFTQCNPSTSTFTFSNASNTSNSFYRIIWGDNSSDFSSSSNFTNITHSYTVGTHTLLFIVTGNNGCIDTTTYYAFVGSNPTGSISSPGSTIGCTGETFSFPFSNIANNPPGTQYLIFVNDGTPDTTRYTQANVPSNFTHTFNNGSCGIAPNNTFTVSYLFTNPCGETPGTIGGIRISKKAEAKITISPKDSVCVNSPVTFTNTGNSGSIVPNSGNASCTSGKSIWQISPSVGWSITSGSLGSDNSSSDVDLWTAGTNSINVTFNTPGIYSIKLKSGTNRCGIDSTIKSICVNPIPTALFNIDQTTGCSSLFVNATGTTNVANCGINRFSWSVTYSSTTGCTPNTSGFVYLNGTNSTSQNPQFQFNNPGVYTINLTTISPGGSCQSQVVSRQITVKSKPIVSWNIPTSVCIGQPITPTSNSNCYVTTATYLWTFTGGSPSSSTSANPGQITYNSAGTNNISLTVTNECGPTTLTGQITVGSAPVTPTISSNSPLCSGNTLNLSATTTTTGVTYSWTGPSGFTSTLQNPVRSNTVVAMSGAYSVTVRSSGCNSLPATENITINQAPVLPTVTTPVNYCQNTVSVPLSATSTTGNTLNWYTVSIGGTASTTAPTPNTSIIGSTTYYVSQINNAVTPVCESARVAILVNVNSSVNISGSFTNPSTCLSSNGTITLSSLVPSTIYSVQYTKNAGSSININLTSNSNGVITLSNLTGGNYTSISVTRNGCSSNNLGPYNLIDPTAPNTPAIGSNGPICSGSTLNLTSSSATSGVTYSWTGPNGFTSTLQNPIRTNSTSSMSGTYSVISTLNGCNSVPATLNVVIVQTPIVPTVITPVNYCQNNTAVPLSATSSAGNNLNWYTVSSGGTASSNPPLPNTAVIGTTTYYVSQMNTSSTACESPRTAITVNVFPALIINGIYSDPSSCLTSDGTMSLTGLAPNTNYTVKFTFNSGAPITTSLISNNSGTIVATNLSAGTYSNINVSLNGCSSNLIGPFTLANPTSPTAPNASSNGPICSGNTLNLNSSSSTSGVTYSWTGPDGFTSSLQNPTRSNATSLMNGIYNVTTTKNGCISTQATVNVVINQTPNNPTVISPVNYCQNANGISLSATNTSGNNLNWYTVSSGGISTSNPPIPNTTLIGTTTYFVSQSSSSPICESNRSSITVNIIPIPKISGSATAPTTCSSSNGTITIAGLTPNTNYEVQYTINGGTTTAFATSNANGVILFTNLASGIYTNISASSFGCSSNTIGPFTLINPTSPGIPTAGSNSPLCAGNTLRLTSISASSGVTYIWTGPGGFSSTLQNPNIPNVTTVASGKYYVFVRSNNCSSEKDSVEVLINNNPSVDLGPDLLLAPGTQHPLKSTILNGPISQYSWTPSNGLSCSNCPLPIADIRGNVSYVLKVTNNYGCVASDSINLKVVCEKTQIFIPNAFTPDGDGINDILMIRSPATVIVKKFMVFNKWGELIFEKLNFPPNNPIYGWDGKIKGIVGPAEVFVYTAEIMCPNGETFFYKGNVSILK